MTDMIYVKVEELDGSALDWAVANAVGIFVHKSFAVGVIPFVLKSSDGSRYSPTKDWRELGPLIDRYHISFDVVLTKNSVFVAAKTGGDEFWYAGENHLVAACRAIVAAYAGPTVTVPRDLVEE